MFSCLGARIAKPVRTITRRSELFHGVGWSITTLIVFHQKTMILNFLKRCTFVIMSVFNTPRVDLTPEALPPQLLYPRVLGCL